MTDNNHNVNILERLMEAAENEIRHLIKEGGLYMVVFHYQSDEYLSTHTSVLGLYLDEGTALEESKQYLASKERELRRRTDFTLRCRDAEDSVSVLYVDYGTNVSSSDILEEYVEIRKLKGHEEVPRLWAIPDR